MFEKTLQDVVKGIRASKRDTALYISQCIAEIKTEINSTDIYVKANALEKLTFLHMMGYSMSWASFASIEVMSSPRFAHKRIGYNAASQGFTQDTEVILLTTNLLKKELRGAIGGGMPGVYEAGLAINCISNIVTEDLARDLLPELTNLTDHPQPYLRKKAVLCLFKLFVKYPQGLRLTFGRIQQCLEDSNPSVVSCAVNVITELSDKNPKNYVQLAPAFFQLLTSSSNNWMLIKVVKLLGSLVPEEPRLARKLLEPLAAIVKHTQAKSLLYEAVHTITLCLPYCRKADGSMPASAPAIVTLCAQTLRSFVEETDQNLKYLGLVGFGSLMSSHPRVLSAPDYRPLILACLSDEDVTIRTRALDLLTGMASRKNLIELITQLLRHVELATGEYKNDLALKIVQMCSGDRYALLQDFSWYLDVLLILGHMRGIEIHSELLRSQIADIALRVLPARPYTVRCMIELFMERESRANSNDDDSTDKVFKDGTSLDVADNGRGKHIMPEILPSAAWIVGEYALLIREALSMKDEDDEEEDEDDDDEYYWDETSKGTFHSIIQSLTAPANTQKLPTSTQSVYVQNAMKVFAAATSDPDVSDEEIEACVETLHRYLPLYIQSTDVEVQERAFTANELLRSLGITSLSFDSVPNATTVNDESESVDSNEEDEQDAEGDLLNMGMPSSTASSSLPKATKKSKSTKNTSSFGFGLSLATKCRKASKTLQYLFIPEPMKPIGAKAQRKKLQSFKLEGVDMEEPVRMDVIGSLLEEERAQWPNKVSIEAVSFTQQRPMRTSSITTVKAPMQADNLAGNMNGGFGEINGDGDIATSSSTSFQRSGMPDAMGAPTQANRQQQDPFYLDAGNDDEFNKEQRHHPNRFGTIQLLDSEEEDDGGRRKKKKGKKAKRKGKKGKGPTSTADSSFPDLSMDRKPSGPAADLALYESDDDEDDGTAGVLALSARKKTGPAQQEFEGLSKVDLTTPLREDEVMPRNEHRVVPEKTTEPPKPKKGKKKKHVSPVKEKKKKKKSSKTPTDNVGDLLDLGMGISQSGAPDSMTASKPIQAELMPMSTSTPAAPPPPAATGNAISTAFDDLLGLSGTTEVPVTLPSADTNTESMSATFDLLSLQAPAPAPAPASVTAVPAKKGGKKLWQKAVIKASSASSSSVNWEAVVLHVKVFPSKGGDQSVMLSLRLINNSAQGLQNVAVRFKGGSGDVQLGTVASGETVESPSKCGPFPRSSSEYSVDLRGSILASGSTASIKISLPAAALLQPKTGLSLGQVQQELSMGNWSSHSAKLEIHTMDPKKAKAALISFLHAAEVEEELNGDKLNGTLAAQSPQGAQVRCLIKIKQASAGGPSIAKVDTKCTDDNLCKAVAADVKKIVL